MSGMPHLQLLVMFFTLLATAAVQPRCDPLTQYLQDGQCCQMCSPGTRMTSLGGCLEPQCQNCDSDEYQDKYTKEPRCHPQSYCDANLNFQPPVHVLTKRTTCTCKDGFHCSSDECISCVPHTACKPGHGVLSEGDHLGDTVCEKCPEGTFSQSDSLTEGCQKWTECQTGQKLLQTGTDESDNTCAEIPQMYRIVIGVGVSFLLVYLVITCLIIGKLGRTNKAITVKNCIELCVGEKKEPPKENNPLVTNPHDASDESKLPERQFSHDEPRTPEEVDYDLSQEIAITTEVHLTDKGKFVMQDKGMKEVKSHDEP